MHVPGIHKTPVINLPVPGSREGFFQRTEKMERKELSPNGKEERKGSSPSFPEEEEREGSSPPFLVDPEMFYDLLMEQQEQM